MIKFFKKYHKWLSIVLTIFIILFALSGIVLNHRKTFSSLDISREILPDVYHYDNWNNAAVLSTLRLNKDSVFIYGNIGVWLTDSSFNSYTDYNTGFSKGVDNRKISSLIEDRNGDLIAGTLFGLYRHEKKTKSWKEVALPVSENRVTDLLLKDDTLIVLTRSYVLKEVSINTFDIIELPEPKGYQNKIGLFKTLWVIHSGEIYGLIGKLIVDIVAIIFIFLSVSGLILFIARRRIKFRKKLKKQIENIKLRFKWNLKWHNKIGWITVVILVITTFTGMFLRPPLLALIGNSEVGKIPFTKLDSPNPWFDKLRRISYDNESQIYVIATYDGIYYSDDDFSTQLNKFRFQPPASVMGVTVFKKIKPLTYLVGSFEGLFEWNYASGRIFDYVKKTPYTRPLVQGPPIGEYKISGYSSDFYGQEIIFDYDFGAASINPGKQFPEMPISVIDNSPMSLWNFALEIHTARFYKIFMSVYYILFIPLAGILILFILISGFIVWLKIRKRRKS